MVNDRENRENATKISFKELMSMLEVAGINAFNISLRINFSHLT